LLYPPQVSFDERTQVPEHAAELLELEELRTVGCREVADADRLSRDRLLLAERRMSQATRWKPAATGPVRRRTTLPLDGFRLHAATRAGTLDSCGREALR
jgi:hypothetical protein